MERKHGVIRTIHKTLFLNVCENFLVVIFSLEKGHKFATTSKQSNSLFSFELTNAVC